uniref:Aminopeptidase n=1 Tax=Corethrella appendiculata TaxID=1370023 RepID=U5EWR8_9DIPT
MIVKSLMNLLIYFIALCLVGSESVILRPPIYRNIQSVVADKDIGFTYRLPNNSRPISYDIILTTDIHKNNFDFTGNVKILVEIIEQTNKIVLNYRQISIDKVRYSLEGDSKYEDITKNTQTNEKFDFLTLESTKNFEKGKKYIFEIDYKGELRNDNGGFYRSSYKNSDGETRWIATTQFETTDARHGFPCYDEPGIRATYKLTIKHGETYHAISNMPGNRSEPTNGYVTTTFEETPIMQTYTLAFVVSDFSYIQNNSHTVFARSEAIAANEGDFALEASEKILNVLEQYLGVNYSLPKIDQIAIPDFSAGAMENWGLVTYREELFLYNNETSELKTKTTIATIIAHEYAHQWFGNLVSPKWWTYTWLNEGFANYFEYVASDIAYPELEIMESFTVNEVQKAFEIDVFGSTRPMSSYVESPAAIQSVFDSISYSKSGSVIRMWNHAFGKDTFVLGLNNYLTKNAYKSAAPHDLVEAIQAAVVEKETDLGTTKVVDIIKSWSTQSGYPLLQINLNNGNLVVYQEIYQESSNDDHPNVTWWLPYNFASKSKPDFGNTIPHGWLFNETVVINGTNQTFGNEWVVFNKQQTGYYRVNYDSDLWQLIISALTDGNYLDIHTLNRAQLIDDAFHLAKSNYIDYDTPMSLIKYLSKEKELAPWVAANANVAFLNRILSGSEQYQTFRKIILNLIEPLYKDLGIEDKKNEHVVVKQLRTIAINLACRMGSEECLKSTSDKLKYFLAEPTKVNPNTRNSIYCNGLRNANADTFNKVLTDLHQSQDAAERVLLISVLGCSENEELLEKYLNTSLAVNSTEFNYREQERISVLRTVYTNGKNGAKIALNFIDENYEKIDNLFGTFGGNPLSSSLIGISNFVTTKELNATMEAVIEKLTQDVKYLTDNEVYNIRRSVERNLLWNEKNAGKFEDWLKRNASATFTISLVIFTLSLMINMLW